MGNILLLHIHTNPTGQNFLAEINHFILGRNSCNIVFIKHVFYLREVVILLDHGAVDDQTEEFFLLLYGILPLENLSPPVVSIYELLFCERTIAIFVYGLRVIKLQSVHNSVQLLSRSAGQLSNSHQTVPLPSA